jgi:hypothetical protein
VAPLVNVLEGAAGVVTWTLALLAARSPDVAPEAASDEEVVVP